MRYLIIALFLIGCTETSKGTMSYEEQKSVAKSFARSLKTGECFRYEADRVAQFKFEKNYRYLDNIHVVIASDLEGLLIAQPEPDCRHSSNESYKCNYWFRTVAFDNMFLIHGSEKKIKCPAELSLKNMIERLKNSEYSKQYNF